VVYASPDAIVRYPLNTGLTSAINIVGFQDNEDKTYVDGLVTDVSEIGCFCLAILHQ